MEQWTTAKAWSEKEMPARVSNRRLGVWEVKPLSFFIGVLEYGRSKAKEMSARVSIEFQIRSGLSILKPV